MLVALGGHKSDAVRRLVEGPLTAFCPTSILQLHPHATVVLDPPAARGLQLSAYYQETYGAKPIWQHY